MRSVVILLWVVLMLIFLLSVLRLSISEGTLWLFEVDSLRIMGRFEGFGSFRLGGWSRRFILVVIRAFSMIIGFTLYYLSSDFEVQGFQVLLLSFVIGMLFLLRFRSGYGVLIGWEILGVSSFILIICYCRRVSGGSSMITVLINRWGDIGLVLFVLWWGVRGCIVTDISLGWNLQRLVR